MLPTQRIVLVESPFAGRCTPDCFDVYCAKRVGDGIDNLLYAEALCRFVTMRGDAPFASHVFCPQFLNDNISEERELGIQIGFTIGQHAQLTVVGCDRGLSGGVLGGIQDARKVQRPIEFVSLVTFAESPLPPGIVRDAWREHWQQGDSITFVPRKMIR